MEVDNLIIEYLKSKQIKQDAIHMQKYELAASSRDEERQLSVKIFNILNPNTSYDSYDNCNKSIDEYCLEMYNVSIHSNNICLKSIIRSQKLNDLGI